MKLLTAPVWVLCSFVLISCKARNIANSDFANDSFKWNEKKEIYDFGKICPLVDLKWKKGGDPAQYLARVIEGATVFKEKMEGDDSGVVVSDKKATRTFYQKIFPTCGPKDGGIELRFTVDRIPGLEYAYEFFVKDIDTNKVIGLAFNSKGKELLEVPTDLAFDKDGNKDEKSAKKVGHKGFRNDKIVRSRLGCFACHPQVSKDYDVKGANEFWKDAKLVEFLDKEKQIAQVVDKTPIENQSFEDIFEYILTQRPRNLNKLLAKVARRTGGLYSSSSSDQAIGLDIKYESSKIRLNTDLNFVAHAVEQELTGTGRGSRIAFGLSPTSNPAIVNTLVTKKGYKRLFAENMHRNANIGRALYIKKAGKKFIFVSTKTKAGYISSRTAIYTHDVVFHISNNPKDYLNWNDKLFISEFRRNPHLGITPDKP